MSYKSVILNDHPTSFYLLDEVISGTTVSYDALKIQYSTYADLRDNGGSYANLGGAVVYDYSGNDNSGVSFNSSSSVLMPLVPGSIAGTKMMSDTKIIYNTPGMATAIYKNNPFSIDFWFKPPKNSINEIPLVFDTTNLIGITYKDGNILFYVGSAVAVAKIEKIELLGDEKFISNWIDQSVSSVFEGIEMVWETPTKKENQNGILSIDFNVQNKIINIE
jgi:hypothetical protein